MKGTRGILMAVSLVLTVALVGASSVRAAGVPQYMNVQGVLYDNDGNPVNGQFYDITVSLYSASSGGTPIATHTEHGYPVNDGIFHLTMTIAGNPFMAAVSGELWMGITVDTDPELTPRQRLTAVGFAFQAKHADVASLADDLDCAGAGCVADNELAEQYARRNGAADWRAQSAANVECDGECVQSAEIANGTIATADIGGSQITTGLIANGTILNEDISPETIVGGSGGAIGEGEIDAYNIATNGVNTDELFDGGVKTIDIANLAVTWEKLAADAVKTDKILDGEVKNADLDTDAVTELKIKDNEVSNAKIKGIIEPDHLKIATDTIRGTVIVGTHLSVAVDGTIAVNVDTLEDVIKASLPLGQNLIQWEDKLENWTMASGSGAVALSSDAPVHGKQAFRFNGGATWVFSRDDIPVDQNRDYYGRVYARRASGTAATFSAGFHAYDKAGASLGDVFFIASAQSPSPAGQYYTGRVLSPGFPANTSYIRPIIAASSDGQVDVDAFEIYELTEANGLICVDCVQSNEIEDGVVSAADLGTDSVGSDEIATNAVKAAEIDANAVGSSEIATGAVKAAEIDTNAVITTKIMDGNVTSAKIADGQVAHIDMAGDAIESDNIADGQVALADLAGDSVDASKIVNSSITTADIGNSQVTFDKIAGNAIDSARIVDNSVGAIDIGINAVGNSELANNAVMSSNIVDGQVTADDLDPALSWIAGGDITVVAQKGDGTPGRLIFEDPGSDQAYFVEATSDSGDGVEVRLVLGNNADTGEKLTIYGFNGTSYLHRHTFDAAGNATHVGNLTVNGGATIAGNITGATITGNLQCSAAGCINSAEIADSTIVNADIAALANILPTKILGEALVKTTTFGGDVSGPYNNLQIGTGRVGTAELGSKAVTNAKIADNTIGQGQIATDGVGAAELANDSVGSGEIIDGTVTGADIAVNTIEDVDLGTNSVGSDELKNNAVGSSQIATGGVDSSDIADHAIDPIHLSWDPGATGDSLTINHGNRITFDDNGNDNGFFQEVTLSGNDDYELRLTLEDNADGSEKFTIYGGTTRMHDFRSNGYAYHKGALEVDGSSDFAGGVVMHSTLNVTGTITGGDLECNNCVDAGDIGANQVGSSEIADGVVGATQIGTNQVTNTDIADNTVGAGQIGTNAVGMDELANNAVGTTQILDNTVGSADIGTNAVGSDELANNAVNNSHVANGALSAAKISGTALTGSTTFGGDVSGTYNNLQIGANTVGSAEVANNSLGTSQLGTNSVDSDELTNGSVDKGHLSFTVPDIDGSGHMHIADGKRLYFDDTDTDYGYFEEVTAANNNYYDLRLHLWDDNDTTQQFTIAGSGGNKHTFRSDGYAWHASTIETEGDLDVDDNSYLRGNVYAENWAPWYRSWGTTGDGGAAITNDNGSYQALMIVGNSSGGGGVRRVKVWDYLEGQGDIRANSNLYANTAVYAPIFRDSNASTTYYVDPSSTSVMNTLTVGTLNVTTLSVDTVNAGCVTRTRCPDDFPYEIGDSCFANSKLTSKTWYQAVKDCGSPGGHLCNADEWGYIMMTWKMWSSGTHDFHNYFHNTWVGGQHTVDDNPSYINVTNTLDSAGYNIFSTAAQQSLKNAYCCMYR